jgi:anti-sigma-K factor RskA
LTCDELRPDYVLYAIGVLEEPEKSELRAHLDRGCENCTAGIREARQLATSIGASAGGPEPPRGLRNRVLAAAGGIPETKWHWRTAWQVGAAMAVLAFAAIFYHGASKDAEIEAVRQQLNQSNLETASLRSALALLQAPETREVTFGQGAPAPPRGRVFFNASSVLLIASNLPAPPAGKVYEMWIIPTGGKPAPAGLFSSTAQGSAYHYFTAPGPLSETDTIAVTLEIASGVDAPTSQPIIGVQL